ncbi:MAG: Phosphotransferase enzyme [Cirrosporium novae-zelandiae]|nr:MAG: Phosphotransferase enzyme [Cirrosporium novae-zelandiae]
MARIPHPNAGPPMYTTASEVATMDFAQSILQIPVSNVLAWGATTKNSVGSEYIIKEEVKGKHPTEVWDDMELEDKLSIIEDIVEMERKFLSISFSISGAIYYASDCFEGCERAEVTSDTPMSVKEDVKNRFVIGPTVEREFWEKERSGMDINRGPWKTQEYVEAITHRGIAWITHHAKPKATMDRWQASSGHNSPQAHIDFLKQCLDVMSTIIPQDADLLSPRLWHRDIDNGNLFIHQDKISSVID